MSPRPRWSDEELYDWLLDPLARAQLPRAEIESGPEGARRLAELEEFLGRLRGACDRADALHAEREGSLVERVLARTTREDLSWRGDLRLLRGWVAGRLRASPVLRVLAASLLVHLLALPILAWYGFVREGAEQPSIRVEPPPLPPFEEAGDEGLAPVTELPAEPELDFELSESDPALYVENSLSWARLRLADGAPRFPDSPSAGEGRLAALLRERSRTLAGRAPRPVPSASSQPASLLERALVCELLLDRALVSSRVPAELEPALLALCDTRLPAGEQGLVAAAALARAESYGMLPASALDALWQARLDLGGQPGASDLIGPYRELRRIAPFDELWRSSFAAACERERLLPPLLLEALREWRAPR